VKAVDDEVMHDAEAPRLELADLAARRAALEEEVRWRYQSNIQDADETMDLEPWQMPELVADASSCQPSGRIPKGASLVLPEAGRDLVSSLVVNLPMAQQLNNTWHLGYSMAVDGVSLRTLYRKVSMAGPCILVVEDSDCCIFGAFCGDGLRPQNRCHGQAGTFLFRYLRCEGSCKTEVFHWAYLTEVKARCQEHGYSPEKVAGHETLKHCEDRATNPRRAVAAGVFCDHTGVVIGLDGPGLFIDQDLLRGGSWGSQAFASPRLAGAKSEFVIRNLEVWIWPQQAPHV
jgi:hypothetical protein